MSVHYTGTLCVLYKQVMKAVLELVPTNQLSTIVMDFEASFWRSVKKLRPDVMQRGCFFHYTQAVWRKVQELGALYFIH